MHRQARRVLADDKYAFTVASLFAVLPYMGWLALAVVALVTLRKGWKAGGFLVLPVVVGHVLLAFKRIPLSVATLGALANVLPCYVSACVLGLTSSWRMVSFVLFLLVVFGVLCFQGTSPDMIMGQYKQIQTLMHGMNPGQMNVLDVWESHGIDPMMLANALLGVQAASLAFSAMVSLLFARSIQSQLFYPGGFQQELLHFRGDKASLFVFVVCAVAAYLGFSWAISTLPSLVFYFLFTGLSLVACLFSQMRPLGVLVLLLVPTVLLPWVILPLYVLLGAFDGLFNFRLSLFSKAKKAN